ncbi:MAG: 30S ribosomal protein S18 [Bacteroidota bacterium]|nr:30S ribosomal protein S18 [Bacteroidota bacterium]
MAQQQRNTYNPSPNRNNFVSTGQDRQNNKKFCWFKKHNIKYIDYKDPDFLLRFINDQGKIYPRRITGTSLKFQRQLSRAIKRSRHMAILPFVSDSLK